MTVVQTAKKLDLEVELKHQRYAAGLVKKLPERLHTEFLSKMWRRKQGQTYSVQHLSDWLEEKTGPAGIILMERANRFKPSKDQDRKHPAHKKFPRDQPPPSRTLLTGAGKSCAVKKSSVIGNTMSPERITCLYCKVKETGHYLETCGRFVKLSTEEKIKWLKDNFRCKRCVKKHEKECQFPKKCRECKGDHRTSLHDVAQLDLVVDKQGPVMCCAVGPNPRMDYSRDVLIKVVPLTVYGPAGKLDNLRSPR